MAKSRRGGAKRDKRIPGSYIIVLQPGVLPAELLNNFSLKPTFSYSSIFIGCAVDKVPVTVIDNVRMSPLVLKVMENRLVSSLSKDILIETLQTKYTVVNRDTGELYDVREVDISVPNRYSILPDEVKAPSKARKVLGINQRPTHIPPKVAKLAGHSSHMTAVAAAEDSDRERHISGSVAAATPTSPVADAAAATGVAPRERRAASAAGGGAGANRSDRKSRSRSAGRSRGSSQGLYTSREASRNAIDMEDLADIGRREEEEEEEGALPTPSWRIRPPAMETAV